MKAWEEEGNPLSLSSPSQDDKLKISLLLKSPEDVESVLEVCREVGTTETIRSAGETFSLFPSEPARVLVVGQELGDFSSFKGLLSPRTSVLLTGPDERSARQIAAGWPAEFYLDFAPLPVAAANRARFLRALKTAAEHARLKADRDKMKALHAEIREIRSSINENVVRELEKRIALQVRYLWFQRKKQKIENILRKIYMANDVSSLLDIVHDMKELVQAGGITFYVLDGNESMGKFLKPLVWDDAFLSHTDFSKYIALLDSPDFASQVVQKREEISLVGPPPDKRLSRRYIELLKSPLRSLLGVPIMHGKEVVGVLEVYNKLHKGEASPQGFTLEDRQVLRGLSEHISLAMTKLNLIQYDALTGILRPDPFFEKAIQKVKERSKRRQEVGAYAMVMGDVDWFKLYNDRNGHEAGNRLLRKLAEVLKASIREDDLLCRYGGEEFLFFLVGVNSLEEACILTERIRKNVEEQYFEDEESQPRNNLTMSFGVTLLPKKEEFYASVNRYELKKIANEADIALAEAKGKRFHGGRALHDGEKEPAKNKVCAYVREAPNRDRLSAVVKPFRHEFFEEKRKAERHYISTLVLYQENNHFKVAKTINLSVGGFKMLSEARLPLAKTLRFFLILEDKAAPFQGEIIYSHRPSEEAAHFHTGVRFRELAAAERTRLENYLLLTSRRVAGT